jgi:hypothetical protein
MKFKILIFVLVLFLVPSVFAQSSGKCDLKIDKAPVLWGYYLGMPFDEFKSLFPIAFKSEVNSFGGRHVRMFQSDFTGVPVERVPFSAVAINFFFFMDRLASITVTNASRWYSVEDFVSGFNLRFNLPNLWVDSVHDSYYFTLPEKRLRCEGFEVSAFLNGRVFQLLDLKAASIYDGAVDADRAGRLKKAIRH